MSGGLGVGPGNSAAERSAMVRGGMGEWVGGGGLSQIAIKVRLNQTQHNL